MALLLFPLSFQASTAGELKLAALHPVLGDMARAIAGDKAVVVDLLRPNGNLHSFEPSPKEIAAAAGASLILSSGKDMEPYLPSLRDTLRSGNSQCSILDLGAAIPDVPSSLPSTHSEQAEENKHDHEHDGAGCCHHAYDPHWWHTPANMKRAARKLAASLTKIDSPNKATYSANLAAWNKKMDSLDAWARLYFASIPTERKILVTGHSSMAHFCKEYGFREIPVQGISREDEGNPARLAAILKELKQSALHISCIFPEYGTNPKSLEEIADSAGIKLAEPLITDGLAPGAARFEEMFRKNVQSIRDGLTQ